MASDVIDHDGEDAYQSSCCQVPNEGTDHNNEKV